MNKFTMWIIPFIGIYFSVAINAEFEIPLIRHQSARELMYEKGTEECHLRMIKNTPDNDSIALYKYLDSDFYGKIIVGHPGQEFNVIFDTAWADSWIISSNCNFKTPGCWFHNKYNSKHSSSYRKNGTEFVTGGASKSLQGYLSMDTIKMGHTNVTNQTFGEITVLPWMYLFTKVDGLIGLAFDSLSANKIKPVFRNLYTQHKIKKPIFSVYISRDKTTEHGGVILLGAWSSKHCFNNTLVFVPVFPQFYWQFKLDSISFVNGLKVQYICTTNCQGAIDTSTKIIIGPADQVKKLNYMIGATELYFGRYMIPCDLVPKIPKVNFTIAGHNFTLHGSDIAQEMSNNFGKICLSIFVPSSLPDTEATIWFLGGAFLERAYTVFDMGKRMIGFAQTR
ncbi:lysosomal aspartic protease-like [Arctopsyche grandis]|uniref:lysosomal aspartic protease-like n=1 Tax=Arctopsyche grandis TaxID=121162 RepID=UPI00406D7E60